MTFRPHYCAGVDAGSVFHLTRLQTPKLVHKTQDKDIDFSAEGVGLRWSDGCQNARRALAYQAWTRATATDTGIVIHDYGHDAQNPASHAAHMARDSSKTQVPSGATQSRRRVKRSGHFTTID